MDAVEDDVPGRGPLKGWDGAAPVRTNDDEGCEFCVEAGCFPPTGAVDGGGTRWCSARAWPGFGTLNKCAYGSFATGLGAGLETGGFKGFLNGLACPNSGCCFAIPWRALGMTGAGSPAGPLFSFGSAPAVLKGRIEGRAGSRSLTMVPLGAGFPGLRGGDDGMRWCVCSKSELELPNWLVEE